MYSSSVSDNKDRPLCDTSCRENVLEGAQLPLATHWSGLSCSSLLSLPLLSMKSSEWHHLEFSFDERRSCSFRLRSRDQARPLNSMQEQSVYHQSTLCSMTTSLVRKSTCALYPMTTNIAWLLHSRVDSTVVDSTNITTDIETAVLSTLGPLLHWTTPWLDG